MVVWRPLFVGEGAIVCTWSFTHDSGAFEPTFLDCALHARVHGSIRAYGQLLVLEGICKSS